MLWRFVAFRQRFWHGYCDSTTPVLDGDRLYAGNGYPWSDATYLFALDRRTGRELWRARTGGLFSGTRPAGDGGSIAISAGARLIVFSKADGRQIWSRGGVRPRWTVADGTVYVEIGSALAALDLATGQERWRLTTHGHLEAPAVAVGDRLYFGAGRPRTLLYVVDRKKGLYLGEPRWLPGFNGRLAAADGRVFAEAGLDGRRVTYEWTDDPDSPLRRDQGLLVIQDHAAYFVDDTGTLHAVDCATGKQRWSRPGLPMVARGALVVNGDVFYQTELQARDRVRAYDWSRGTELWSFESGDWVSPLALGSDAVYLSSDDCTIVALRRGR